MKEIRNILIIRNTLNSLFSANTMKIPTYFPFPCALSLSLSLSVSVSLPLSFTFNYVFMCGDICSGVRFPTEVNKMSLALLELELSIRLQAVVSCKTGAQESELRSSGKSASALNDCAISPSPMFPIISNHFSSSWKDCFIDKTWLCEQ